MQNLRILNDIGLHEGREVAHQLQVLHLKETGAAVIGRHRCLRPEVAY